MTGICRIFCKTSEKLWQLVLRSLLLFYLDNCSFFIYNFLPNCQILISLTVVLYADDVINSACQSIAMLFCFLVLPVRDNDFVKPTNFPVNMTIFFFLYPYQYHHHHNCNLEWKVDGASLSKQILNCLDLYIDSSLDCAGGSHMNALYGQVCYQLEISAKNCHVSQ